MAVVFHCSSATTQTRTSQPQRWGKPALKTAGKQKYAKGKRADELFKSKSWTNSNLVPIPLPRFDQLPSNSTFAKVLEVEQASAVDIEIISDVARVLEDAVAMVEKVSLQQILKKLLSLKLQTYRLTLNIMLLLRSSNSLLSVKQMDSPPTAA